MSTRTDLPIIPKPKQWNPLNGSRAALPMDISIEGVPDETAQCWTEFWCEQVVPLAEEAADATLAVRVDESARMPKKVAGAYVLTLGPEPRIVAADIEGAWNALQTLKQLARSAGKQGRLPAVEIRDWPAAAWRMFQVDLGRSMAFRRGFFEQLLGELAELKFNALQVYVEHNVVWQAWPELAEVDAMTYADAAWLEDEAARYGITVIPATNICRHMEGFLQHPRLKHLQEMPLTKFEVPGGQLRLSHPEAWGLVEQILDELLAMFRGPFIHLGMDETHYIGRHPETETKPAHEWFGELVEKACDHLRKQGRRGVVWGDKFLHPDDYADKNVSNCTGITPPGITKAIEYVPEYCVINDWHYSDVGAASVTYFTKRGHEVWAAPYISGGHHFMSLEHLDIMPGFTANAIEAGAEGAMLTTWGWYGGFRIFDHRFYIALFADTAWRGEKPELKDVEKRWTTWRFGRALPYVAMLKAMMEPTVKAFDALLSAGEEGKRPHGQSVRAQALWKDAHPFDTVRRFGKPAYRDVVRAQKALGRARERIDSVAGRAKTHADEIADLVYYIDLYQHLLDRLTLGIEVACDYRDATMKMHPDPPNADERAKVFAGIREKLEPLYQQALEFLRIQRRLYADIGAPLRDLEAVQHYIRGLAHIQLMLRQAEDTGLTPDPDDLWGGFINDTRYEKPVPRP